MKNTKKKAITIITSLVLLIMMLLPLAAQAGIEIPDPTPPSDPKLKKLAAEIMGYAQWIGIIVAVVMLVFYGVRYFTSAPDKQADLKKALWGYLIGAACIFGASLILGFIGGALKSAGEGMLS